MPVRAIDVRRAAKNHNQDDADLDDDDGRVDVRGLPDADHDQHGDRGRDNHGRQVDDRIRAAASHIDHGAGRRGKRRRKADADEVVKETREVARPPDGDSCRAERIFEDEIPADDPGNELAERRIAVRVGGTGDRHG